ncbi:poly(A) polymerase [Cohaesibacter sp. ES.047]|uniref:CCA tRNA nucleotidyltransferase n=1 Tax=Cohaesibacter sp. ES.047 TaxID=1798205 RepID=UPI000BB88C3E|nr:CCA tRNA nucleotidyltransferase [Cohaesibacter sp. ES.047]SNY91481.1 poly(A) polymerase [Cohaesibacter sp. ES.047]
MSAPERSCLVATDPAFAWLRRSDVQALFALLNRDGEDVRIVGGAVRNSLMGIPVKDFDCATTAEPSLVMNWARDAGVRALPTGLDHGTVTLLIDETPFEVTTLRSDIETDGRHAEVAFGRDWAVDAQRRDFTMNAVYVDQEGQLFDPTGCGVADAKARFVRFIGDADRRIAEDYLRILRFFRFYAQYGEQYRAEDYHACIAAQRTLSTLSAERVGSEVVKLVEGPFAFAALKAMYVGGMLGEVLGAVPRLQRFSRLMDYAVQLSHKPDIDLLLTVLSAETEEECHRVARTLRLSNRLRDNMLRLVREVGAVADPSEDVIHTLAYRYGKQTAVNLILLALVQRRIDPDLTELSTQLHDLALWAIPDFPVSGRDLIDRGMKPGPDLGARLQKLEAIWIESGFTLSRSHLLSDEIINA